MLGFTQHQAQGTSLTVLVVPVTALAVFNYYKAGHINWKYALIIAGFFVVVIVANYDGCNGHPGYLNLVPVKEMNLFILTYLYKSGNTRFKVRLSTKAL